MTPKKSYASTLREALGQSRQIFLWLALFSFFINLLMLTGPIYMLQIYDNVLASGSVPTLAALSGLIAALFIGLGLLEIIRGALLQRAAGRFDRHVSEPIFDAAMKLGLRDRGRSADQPMRDARTIRQFITSPALNALYDAPWSPAFLALIFFMHPWLGYLAIGGAATLIVLAVLNEFLTRRAYQRSSDAAMEAQSSLSAIVRNVEAVEAMGMRPALQARWRQAAAMSDAAAGIAGDRNAMFTSFIKAFRLFLQSAMLGLGAYLAIQQAITPGVMIAASIILGRALAPLEQGVGQWRGFVGVRDAWARLKLLLSATEAPVERMPLPKAVGALDVANLTVAAPGTAHALLSGVTFSLEPGEALGVLGQSASGKSTLARAITGVWAPAQGTVRLDGAEMHERDRAEIGPQVGYLPQDVELFAGTVRENIARFQQDADPEMIVRAAQNAGCHDMILHLPEGYETDIGPMGGRLSAGQRQRVALARALFGDPKLIVLDEPNANLDAEGDEALSEALIHAKQRGATVIVIAHRPLAIKHVDKILVIQNGGMRAFGPRDEVMRATLRPAATDEGGEERRAGGGKKASQAARRASNDGA